MIDRIAFAIASALVALSLSAAFYLARAHAAVSPFMAIMKCEPFGALGVDMTDGQKALFIICMQSRGFTFTAAPLCTYDPTMLDCWIDDTD